MTVPLSLTIFFQRRCGNIGTLIDVKIQLWLCSLQRRDVTTCQGHVLVTLLNSHKTTLYFGTLHGPNYAE